MDQPSPPGPALFHNLVLILNPPEFRKLLSKLWVTPSHTANPSGNLDGRFDFDATADSAVSRHAFSGSIRIRHQVSTIPLPYPPEKCSDPLLIPADETVSMIAIFFNLTHSGGRHIFFTLFRAVVSQNAAAGRKLKNFPDLPSPGPRNVKRLQ